VAGTTVTLAASADSRLPVALATGSGARCTVDAGGALTLRSSGSCVVTASQAGDADWNPALPVTRIVAVAAAPSAPQVDPDTSWYQDPIPKQRRKRLAAARPGRQGGPVRLTKAAYRTHNGTVAVPARSVRGHQLAAGQAVQLTGLFRFDSARLSARGRRALGVLARSMRDVEAFTCEGYADYGNAVDHERRLAKQRGRAVCALLVRTLGRSRVEAKAQGYGPSRPMVVGGTAKARTANRRVAVLVRR
jgi:outer membrane protein OmpA-like peptidoglycan-associated protein